MKPAVIATIICCFSFGLTHAQSNLKTIEELRVMALRQNLSLKAAGLQSQYWQAIGSSTFAPGKTQFSGEYGHINSFNSDSRFNVSQSFNLPQVYKRQASFYAANRQASQSSYVLQEKEIVRAVSTVFYRLVDLYERKKMLMELDSIYSRFALASKRRLDAGEANIIEQTTAQGHAQQVLWQLENVNADIAYESKQLQLLTHSADPIEPSYTTPLARLQATVDTSSLRSHPAIELQKQQELVAHASVQLEKNTLAPDLMIGYSNQSFAGWQSKDGITQQNLSAGDRFGLVQAGIGIPIFNGAAKARIKASEINVTAAKANTEKVAEQVRVSYEQAQERVSHYAKVSTYYRNTGMTQSATLIAQAELAFSKGNFDFLQWTILMAQAYEIRVSYLDAMRNYNLAVVELEYYLSK